MKKFKVGDLIEFINGERKMTYLVLQESKQVLTMSDEILGNSSIQKAPGYTWEFEPKLWGNQYWVFKYAGKISKLERIVYGIPDET